VGEDKKEFKGGARQSDERLAKDVARLYSWAHVGDSPYRDFFRLRKQQNKTQADQTTSDSTTAAAPAAQLFESAATEPSLSGSSAEPVRPNPPQPVELLQQAELPTASSLPVELDPLKAAPSARAIFEPEATAIEPPAVTRFRAPQTVHAGHEAEPADEERTLQPAMAIYSLAGGVGKTTLCANLGRALYSIADRVLLVDASGSCLLPFYFGGNNLRPGLHTFTDPDLDQTPLRVCSGDEITADWLNHEVQAQMDAAYWTIFDLGPASTMLLPQILGKCAFVLIPLLPDLNSILSVSRIESMIESMRVRGAVVPSPFYLFNKFDPEDPIDEGARELVLRQCGGRLLPWSIGYDSEAAKAIASRKTVIDHAPDAELAHASLKLAALLQQTVAGDRASRTRRHRSDV